MPRNYSDSVIKILWGRSAGRCAFQACREQLVMLRTDVDPVATIGEMAHIVAHAKGQRAPRVDLSFPDHQRDTYDNLILLCNTHHRMIDVQPNSYTPDDLRRMKAAHEQYVVEALTEQIPNVTFAELEVVTKAFLNGQALYDEEFSLTPPVEKMAKNGLSGRSASLIRLGMANARTVERFVGDFTMTDHGFAEALKAGFLEKYAALRASGLGGDELFEAMEGFAASGSSDFKKRAAGLSVLTYLFEKCEVFEK